ncbi:MAG TPA: hypothetical protein VF681_15370 [Abditibacteriaceae bacterium]
MQEDGDRNRRAIIYEAYFVEGRPPARIARDMGITRDLVRKIIHEIRKQAGEDYPDPATAAREEAIDQLDVTLACYDEAWERSVAIADREEFIDEAAAGDPVNGKRRMVTTKSQRRTRQEEFNTKALEGMRRCIEARSGLLGLYEKKSAGKVPDKPVQNKIAFAPTAVQDWLRLEAEHRDGETARKTAGADRACRMAPRTAVPDWDLIAGRAGATGTPPGNHAAELPGGQDAGKVNGPAPVIWIGHGDRPANLSVPADSSRQPAPRPGLNPAGSTRADADAPYGRIQVEPGVFVNATVPS